ncbi:HlyD family type I secretion periplasmic adaptor subunit [Methylosinus sp. H3A]|uniref:HlyD family type I secretion periplasmic adaptor subunit n=1 Tax=Methylosinus sp. H3A TaxID=2785786 RepID=UPI0018C2A31D|nr:HlyD family type I secretion periplasmic adaptor subunit [Methylosinus sp. H3A]MBG0811749.1 HlyD family type I secretion periplasmic adaptor subunit [Methylosinus sp. H3A]
MSFLKHFADKETEFVRRQMVRSDQEFLPAALAISETPPSPIQIGLLWSICLLAILAIGWSYFGQIDILATAQGKIQPSGRVKTVQPLEIGKVVAVQVENGQHVATGDVLIELDPTEAFADETSSRAAHAAFRAEWLRRKAAIAAAERRDIARPPTIVWPEDISEEIRAREQRVLDGDLSQLRAAVLSFDAQIVEKRAEEKRLENTIAAQETLIDTLTKRVSMRTALVARKAIAAASLIDAQEALQSQQTALATQKGQLAEARANVDVLTKERDKAFGAFLADNAQKLSEAGRQIDDLEQKSSKAHARAGHMTLSSPIAGVVMGLSVTSRNQVVTPGEELMRIIPDDAGLEIECYAQNKDIGFIQTGQTAVIKIESFPFTRYGSLDGHVTRVARDAIPEPDAQTIEGNPAKTTKSSYFGGGQRTQNLVFPVTVAPDSRIMNVDGQAIPLSPGMAVSVEIKTGKRRILEYLFSPLVETASRAMRER